jgi:hypothetical protein
MVYVPLSLPNSGDPTAMKVPESLELRQVPDTDDDMRANFSSAWQRSK